MDAFNFSLSCWQIGLFAIVTMLCSLQAQAQSETVSATGSDQARYSQIERLIMKNRHLSAHFVLAVDARTIKAVRNQVSNADIPVLVEMLGNKNYGVASAASGLLVTLGEQVRPILILAKNVKNSPAAIHAHDALKRLDDCADEKIRNTINPDLCPTVRPMSR
jgi:putative ribosome biogenesis GTPase RsgA